MLHGRRESQYTITSRLGVIESSSKYIESVMKKKYFNFPFPTAHYVFFLITKKNQQSLSFIIMILFQGANSNMKKKICIPLKDRYICIRMS